MTIQVHKAERRKAKLRLLLTGPSGSGKTYTAITVGRGLVGQTGKILLVDTERGSGELYADLTSYDVAPLEPPYKTEHYIEAIKYAEDNSYDVVILDSITHAWAGQGGLLEQVDTISGSGNKFTAWASVTPKHQAFLDKMLSSKIHVIATVRSKTEYVLIPDEKGKNKPQKRGLAPIQRDGVEYEFTLVLDMSPNHAAEASKDRTGLFDGEIFYPTEETGAKLAAWLDKGSDAPAPQILKTVAPTQPKQTAPEPVKKQPEPEKKIPSRTYTKLEVENIRKRYESNGWNQKAIDAANVDGLLWDAEVIDADFKKRAAMTKKPAEAAPAPAEVPKPKQEPEEPEAAPLHTCPKCGKPSMTDKDAGVIALLMQGEPFDFELCKECATALWNEKKKAVTVEKEKPKKTTCADCGGGVLPDEEAKSIAAYGVSLCPKCYKARLQADMKKKQTLVHDEDVKPAETKKPEHTCDKCGAPMTNSKWAYQKLFSPAGKVYCAKCTAELSAKSSTEKKEA